MGKYNVGYHGPDCQSNALDGIATLTDDTLAIGFNKVRECVKSIAELKKEILESLSVPKEFDAK